MNNHEIEFKKNFLNISHSPYRHEPLVLVQPLLVGGDEESSVLDPARVEARLLLQVFANDVPGVSQELHLHITGTELPQQAWGTDGLIG